MRGRRGSTFLLGLMVAVMLFLATVVLIEPVRDGIDIARSGLGCGGEDLGVYVELSCIVTGSMLPLFILAGAAVALGAIGIRRVQSQPPGGV